MEKKLASKSMIKSQHTTAKFNYLHILTMNKFKTIFKKEILKSSQKLKAKSKSKWDSYFLSSRD